jgi:hypothetical protein
MSCNLPPKIEKVVLSVAQSPSSLPPFRMLGQCQHTFAHLAGINRIFRAIEWQQRPFTVLLQVIPKKFVGGQEIAPLSTADKRDCTSQRNGYLLMSIVLHSC